jgi:hypothetical protein
VLLEKTEHVAVINVRSLIRLTGLLLLTGIAISCGSRQAIVEDRVPNGSYPRPLVVPKDARARTIYFDKLVLNLPVNEKYGEVKAGFLCEKSRDLVWGEGSSVLRESDVRNAFNDLLEQSNYSVIGKSDELFEDVSKIEVVVAGLIKELHIEICSRFNMNLLLMPLMKTNETKVAATASVKVNWQVF